MSRRLALLSATPVWALLMLIAVACWASQESNLASRFGKTGAHVLSTLAIVVLCSAVIYVFAKAANLPLRILLLIGVYWTLLTVTFKYALGHHVLGRSWVALLDDYNLPQGRLGSLVLATVLLGPVMAGLKHNRLSSCLIILQAFGGVLGTIVAASEIESICISGPLFFLAGSAIALVSYRTNRPVGFCFGLAAPTIAVLCFSLICGLEWSPDRAHVPISSILVVFILAYIPLGVRAFLEAQDLRRVPQRRRVQFTIASLLGAMLATALFLGLCREGSQQAIAITTFGIYGASAAFAVRQFRRVGATVVEMPTSRLMPR